MSTFAKGNPFSLFFRGPLFFGTPCFLFFFGFFLALQRLARLKCNLEPNCKHIWGSLFCSHTPPRSVLDFESFAGRGQMLDGRVLGASQVEYKPFGKPPLKRESTACAAPRSTSCARCPALSRRRSTLSGRLGGHVLGLFLLPGGLPGFGASGAACAAQEVPPAQCRTAAPSAGLLLVHQWLFMT